MEADNVIEMPMPSGDAAPDPADNPVQRTHVDLPVNLAENWKLAKKFHDVAHAHFQRFVGQEQRDKLEENMKAADAMYRCSKRRDRTVGGEDQQADTLSNVPSPSFYNSIRVTTAGQRAIIFPDDGSIPAQYTVPCNCDEYYTQSEAERVAKGQNGLLRYAWRRGGWDRILKRSLLYNNKYGQELLGLEWDYRTATRVERVVGYYNAAGEPVEYDPKNPPLIGQARDSKGNIIDRIVDEDGRPRSFVFMEKTRVVADAPCLSRYDLKDAYYDMALDDIQQNQCFVLRSQQLLSDLYASQRDGMYVNAKLLGSKHLFRAEDAHDSTVLSDRQDNADESAESRETGLFDTMHVWLRAPIDDDAGKRASNKGKWSENMEPVWYEAVFAGQFGQMSEDKENSACIPLMIRRNPYHHGKLPYNLIHSHDDDKGALHLGYQTLLEALYEENTAAINQLFDNRTLGIYRPWIGERGNVLSRDLRFRQGNQVKWVKAGTGKTALTQLDIKDMTATILPQLQAIQAEFDKTAGTDKPISGEYAGSRTTGTEYLGVREQAMKPAIEDAEFVSDQIFPWLLPLAADLFRQFGDPAVEIAVPEAGAVLKVNPATLYGPLDVEVVSIGNFVTEITQKQNLINMIQVGVYDRVAPILGPDGQTAFWRDFFGRMNMHQFCKHLKPSRYVEAENQAWSENMAALNDPATAAQDMPQPGEMDDVHIGIHKAFLTRYKLATPPDQQNPDTIRIIEMWITVHEQNKMVQAQMPMQGEAPMNQSNQPPGMAGEATGDALAGAVGQMVG